VHIKREFSVSEEQAKQNNTTDKPNPSIGDLFDDVSSAQPDKKQPVAAISGLMINYVIIAVTFLAIGLFLGTNFVPAGNSNIDEASLERVIRDVMADMDFGSETVDRFELVDDDPYLGDEDAPIVIVEFSDFRCPYCGRHFELSMQPLIDNYGDHIRYVFRDFAALGPESVAAAVAANCANEQGEFWNFHNEFYRNQTSLGRDYYIATAEQFDLDVDAYTQCIDESRYLSEVNSDGLDGQINGISGTPGFFINGTFIRGAQPYEYFERIVLRELEKAGIETDVSNES